MNIPNLIILILIFTLSPAAVLWLCRRYTWLDKIGPVVILYLLGASIGNLGLLGLPLFPKEMPIAQEVLNSIMVPLAIPLMLFGSVFKKSDTRSQILSMVFGIVSLVITVVCAYLLFGKNMSKADDPLYGARLGAMLTGTYTGGTVNMASIQKMLAVPEETFVLANTFDMIVCFGYLMFLVTIGIRFFRFILKSKKAEFTENDKKEIEKEIRRQKENPYKGLFSKEGLKSGLSSTMTTILIFGLSFATASLLNNVFKEDIFMMVFILMLTSLGLAASFIKPVRNLKYSFDIGMYFIYVFSIVVASMADLTKIDFAGSMNILGFISFIIFGSLFLHFLFSKILKIDADTMIITSVTYINSPPFVPMIAAAMKNRNVLIPGLTIGIFGYAIGNYLGLLIFQLLSKL